MASIAYPSYAKSLTVSSHIKYGYAYIPPISHHSTIVFLHGFPSSSFDWRFQVSHLTKLGYGALVIDMLGYGDSDKPTSLAQYRFKKMASEIVEIVDHEGIERAHFVAHDFGSQVLSRIVFYNAKRVLTASFLSVPMQRPGKRFEIDMVDEICLKMLGVEKFGYMRFLAEEDSWKLMDEHPDSVYDNLWKWNYEPEAFNFPGVFKQWLEENRRAEPPDWVGENWRVTRDQIFKDGYRGPTTWYRVLLSNDGMEEEETEPTEAKLSMPIMFIDEAPGVLSLPNNMAEMTEDLELQSVSTKGHWIMLESPKEVNENLEKFLKDKASGSYKRKKSVHRSVIL